MKKIIIMAGLPGSGKTTLANKMKEQDNMHSIVWGFDKYSRCNMIDDFFIDFNTKINYFQNHIIDGLFLNNKDYVILIEKILNMSKIKKKSHNEIIFEFHYFEPDIEACIWNDKARKRAKSSESTIKNSTTERPDLSILEKITNSEIKIIDCKVTRADEFEVYYGDFKDDFDLYGDELVSDSWSKGGNVCDCWGDSYTCSEDEDPDFSYENFPEFNNLLYKICPEIDDELKTKLFEETVNYNEYDDSDYYGGTQYLKAFVCDLKKLYKMLDENELLVMHKMSK